MHYSTYLAVMQGLKGLLREFPCQVQMMHTDMGIGRADRRPLMHRHHRRPGQLGRASTENPTFLT